MSMQHNARPEMRKRADEEMGEGMGVGGLKRLAVELLSMCARKLFYRHVCVHISAVYRFWYARTI